MIIALVEHLLCAQKKNYLILTINLKSKWNCYPHIIDENNKEKEKENTPLILGLLSEKVITRIKKKICLVNFDHCNSF